ncbi:unnamed protein product, partial [Leptidea sinapis]
MSSVSKSFCHNSLVGNVINFFCIDPDPILNMIHDDEFEKSVTTDERIKTLGFKPQKEILANHLLPYAAELDEESNRFLAQVKTNLAKAVMLREMKPACGVWSSRLMKYIRIYGLKFGKEDHIAFIKLVYELILIPDLEPGKVHKFTTLFIMLTKKRYLISPEELTLPWRPLYEVGIRLFHKKSSHIGLFHYMQSLESSYISMVKCARPNPGAVDWSSHVPKMFMRFLHALNLPVSYKDMQHPRHHNIDGVVLKQLKSFLGGVESYLHSANAGRWSFKLRDLLRKLAKEFLNRVRREREKKYSESWENTTPASYKLRKEDIDEFVAIVLEPTLQAVYSRSGAMDISGALLSLATLRPALVIPPLLDKLQTALTSLTEPHRVTAAITAVAAVARPLLRGADAGYPDGCISVVPLLTAVLPGLDPNDIKKTIVTLHMYLMFSTMMPFIDCSSAPEYWPDLTEEERLVCEATAQFEDFVLVFFDKVFTIIQSCVTEHARLDTKDTDCLRSKTDAVTESGISTAAQGILTQCSPKIFKEALRKFKAFATESTFETNVSGSMVGTLLRVFARVDPEPTAAAFLPDLCRELLELLSTDEALREENPPRELVYRLVLLKEVVGCEGTVILKYIPQILPVLDRALKLHSLYALKRACDTLNTIMSVLSTVELKEIRCLTKDYGDAPRTWLPIREWGKGCRLKDADFKWHVPNEEEAKCAQMLSDRYLKPEVERLQQWLAGEKTICRERMNRSESQVPALKMPLTTGVRHEVTLHGANMRVALTALLTKVQAKMLAEKTDDTRGLEMLIQVWERVVVMKSFRAGPSLEGRIRLYNSLERAFDGRGGACKYSSARLRMLVADSARLLDESRLELVCDAGITPCAVEALSALYELSIYTYSSVRLYWILMHYPYSYRVLIPKILSLLPSIGEGDEEHARHKGALFILLGPKSTPVIAKHDWKAIRDLWSAVLRAPLSEKPSIHRLEQAFADTLHRQLPTINTRLTMSKQSVQLARVLLTPEQLNDPEFVKQLEKAEEREKAQSDDAERAYYELIDNLVNFAETFNGQWRRLELVMQMLTCCPSLQSPYPPRALLLFCRSLLHENIAVRRAAQRLTMKDLDWAIWSEDKVLKTDEEWDKPWLRNLMYGFYAWPKEIEFFSNEQNINRLVNFLTVEEKKGKDKFSGIRFTMLRLLFAHFGERVSGQLLQQAQQCAGQSDEAKQRFAAEVAAAGLRAPRYWPRDRALRMQKAAVDIVVAATGVEKMDPTRGHEVLQSLMQLCTPEPTRGQIADQKTSFVTCARLYALQNIRETVGSLLMTIFNVELVFPGGDRGRAPCLKDFLDSPGTEDDTQALEEMVKAGPSVDKALVKRLTSAPPRMYGTAGARREWPHGGAVRAGGRGLRRGRARTAAAARGAAAGGRRLPGGAGAGDPLRAGLRRAGAAGHRQMCYRSWWARLACLDYALPLLFYGLPLLCAVPERAVRAENFALTLMRDARVEDEESTLRSLNRSCRSKELRERHCGVLGLCAYLSSRPYSLGPKLGDVLAELARHINAPDPIPATIRAALADFRRTHQDDWPKHREQLTEEELDLLADLTSPPTYCA